MAAKKKSARKASPKPARKSSPKPGKKSSPKLLVMKYRAKPPGNSVSKPRRAFGDPVALPKPHPNFVAIPSTNKQPKDLSYALASAVDPSVISGINATGQMVFFSVGDTGDINATGITRDLALQMEALYNSSPANNKPAWLYHLGDVVYYNGESIDYRDQFYDPYKFLNSLIFAVPGNHDGQTIVNKGDPPDPEPSLKGFFANFCDSKRQPSQSSPYRLTMDQPWPYWVLNTPLATIIGLYSNVDGSLDNSTDTNHPQFNWLISQLKAADKTKALLLTVHHCPFSLDSEHGGYGDILDAIDQAVAASGNRYPDLVLSGHVHNYQRFSRQIGNRTYPYIVAGNGGYASAKTMHKLQVNPTTKARITTPFATTQSGVTLQKYNEDLPGFLRLTVSSTTIKGEYFTNDMTGGDQTAPAFDTFSFDLTTKKVTG
ncbi:MAG TPA: metallophosphoesterase [Puia sp.]|nr:metallophosphoesterase [Puia sp.]